MALTPLWAVHIADGVLSVPWLVGGFILASLMAMLGAWRIRDEEIPQVALLTAAFTVASLIHIRVPPTSVHLLLNGLMGVVLGWRAGLAIPIGLFTQATFMAHGGFTTIGINSCVMALPALLAGYLFAALRRVPWVRRPWFRGVLVAASTMAWLLSLVYSLALLSTQDLASLSSLNTQKANLLTFHPLTLAAAVILSLLAAWAERHMENGPEFPLGLLIGEVAVLTTALLNAVVLVWGGNEDWGLLALFVFVAHLPVAAVEGVVLGFTVSFLAKVKPEMIGWTPPREPA